MNTNKKLIVIMSMMMGVVVQMSPAAVAFAADKLVNIKKVTIKYKHEGAASGWSETCMSNWGNLVVERREITMKVMGIENKESKKVITKGPDIITIDYLTNKATKTRNPMYDSMKKQVSKKGGVKTGEDVMKAMGGQKTNRTGRFAGYPCTYWTLMGSESCVSKEGLTLHVKAGAMGINNIQTAVEVKKGKGCSTDAAKVPAGMKVQEVNIDRMMGGQRPPAGDKTGKPPAGFNMDKLKDMFSR